MLKIFKKYLILVIIIYILVIFSSITIYAWYNCPFEIKDDPYPGECNRYIDTDDDGICDHSQAAPEYRDTITVLNEENIKRNLEEDNKYSKEMDEKIVTGSKPLPDYNFLEIFFMTLFIYCCGKFLAQKLQITLAREKKFWNTFLLISFIGSAGTGMVLVFSREFYWFRSINFNYLFWHVEFSIAMAILGIFHTLWHLKYYLSIFKRGKRQ